MSIQVKIADGSLRRVVTPWVCTAPGVVLACHHAFVKVAADDVREAYPLQPDPVTGAVVSTVYRNDRIEIDVDWEPGVGGEPPAYYVLNLTYHGIGNETYRINAPTSAMTLTGAGGNGYHGWAGTKLDVKITPYSIADRPGESRTVTTTIAQLPAPPPPTVYSVNVQSCRAYHTFTSPGGRRITSTEIRMHAPQLGLDWYSAFSPGSHSGVDVTPWDPNSIGGTNLNCYIRSKGPGGVSNWVSVSGSIPGPTTVSNYCMYNGWMYAALSGAFVGTQVWVQNQDGSWANAGYATNGDLYVAGSNAWARDGSWQRRLMLRPYNQINGWTGRDQYYGWIRKMPNPYYFRCDDAMTRRNGVWRTEVGLAYHGATTPGNNEAWGFYNTKFNDSLGVGVAGYRLTCTRLQLNLYRAGNHGSGGAVPIKTWLHRAPNPGGNMTIGGGVDIGPIGRDSGGWYDLPAGWGTHLIHVEDGYRGILLYHTNTALTLAGGVSAEYAILLDEAWENAGYWCFGVAISHDG